MIQTRLRLLILLLILMAPGVSSAQQCGLETRVAFAGHGFPLDADIVEEDLAVVQAFPSWGDEGLGFIVFVTHPPDGTNRLFLVDLEGIIQTIPNEPDVTAASLTTFLDIQSLVEKDFTEEGLFGMAFHPDYANNGYFYVHHTTEAAECAQFTRCQQIVRYEVSANDPNVADPSSKYVVLEIDRPGPNQFHNGGMLAFGDDGMLYIAVGDQGRLNLPQDTTSLRGKLLRIDVDSGTEFNPGIPPDNPFGNEVWHYGLRNPFRFSFDRNTPGDLWLADVGEVNREEVNWIRASEGPGLDLGWPDCEGTRPTSGGGTCAPHRFPDIEYDRSNNRNGVAGGYVYRGPVTALAGMYIFGDLNGEILAWDRTTRDPNTGLAIFESLAQPFRTIVSFGEDAFGELYTWGAPFPTDGLFRLEVAGSSTGDPFPEQLSLTGLFSDTANMIPAAGLIEYEVTTPLWSDGALKKRWMALPGNSRITFSANGNWSFPVGTVFVKHFELEQVGASPRRLETRIMLHQNDRWIGFTYRWNEAGTDADLLRASLREDISLNGGGSQTWIYPSPADCLTCHSAPTGRVLGARSSQLNRDFDFTAVTDNQLHAWNCIGLFDTDIGASTQFSSFAALEDTSSSRSLRARSYLASNCAVCHQPGTIVTNMDLRPDILLGEMNVIDETPARGDLGLPSPFLIDPGDHENSVLWLRNDETDEALRMPKGTLDADVPAVDLLRDWIDLDLWDANAMMPFLDSDEDGSEDSTDNCPRVANGDQADSDDDGVGDLCDPDRQPDLVAQTSAPASASPGATVSIGATISNTGLDPAAASQVRVHLSLDDVLGASDYLVGDCFVGSLTGGSNETCIDTEAVVPSELEDATGEYNWIACADGLELTDEANENNNCHVATVLIPEPQAFFQGLAALSAAISVAVIRRRRRTT